MTGAGTVQLRRWSEADFAAAQPVWAGLLARSAAHPLFMCWDWQWAWWRQRAARGGAELCLFAGYDRTGALVGLAPLYRHRARHRLFTAQRVESLGSEFRQPEEVFTEFYDFIAERGHADAFARVVLDTLDVDRGWSDLVLAHTRPDGLAARALRSHGFAARLRVADTLTSYAATLPDDFSTWLEALGGDVRRKLWNQRGRLEQPRLEFYAAEEVDAALTVLDAMLAARWGQPHYRGARREFHRQLAGALARRGELRLSRLVTQRGVVSVMYDVRIGATEYNLQSGFDAQFAPGTSPAYLHVGYCLERACGEGVRVFDFLAGTGRQRDYKRDFNSQAVPLVTLQAIRSRPLAWLYGWHDRRTRGAAAQADNIPASNEEPRTTA